jgi:hypothetical protein
MKVSQYEKFQVQSQKPSSAMRTAKGMEDPELPLLQRLHSLDLPASEIAAQINASQSSSNRHLNNNCSKETVNKGFMVKLLQRNHY